MLKLLFVGEFLRLLYNASSSLLISHLHCSEFLCLLIAFLYFLVMVSWLPLVGSDKSLISPILAINQILFMLSSSNAFSSFCDFMSVSLENQEERLSQSLVLCCSIPMSQRSLLNSFLDRKLHFPSFVFFIIYFWPFKCDVIVVVQPFDVAYSFRDLPL